MVRFIDRMLAGTQFIFPAADGIGFLRMEGHEEEAVAREDRAAPRVLPRGRRADGCAGSRTRGRRLRRADDEAAGRRARASLRRRASEPFAFVGRRRTRQGSVARRRATSRSTRTFCSSSRCSCSNTRQGFYGDPVYGGNENRVGWGVIGFDGPPSLASTMDGSYTTRKYMVEGAEWPYDQHPEVLRYRRAEPARAAWPRGGYAARAA